MTALSLCRLLAGAFCCACLSALPAPALANTPETWVELGQQVHGGFGAYIALGIRIGLDARERLNTQPRELDVTYYNGATAPCPCVADGVMLATIATPGQNSLRVVAEPSPPGTFGVVEIRHKVTGEGLRYTIPDSAQEVLDNWNATLDDRERYDIVMAESEPMLFSIESLP